MTEEMSTGTNFPSKCLFAILLHLLFEVGNTDYVDMLIIQAANQMFLFKGGNSELPCFMSHDIAQNRLLNIFVCLSFLS